MDTTEIIARALYVHWQRHERGILVPFEDASPTLQGVFIANAGVALKALAEEEERLEKEAAEHRETVYGVSMLDLEWDTSPKGFPASE